jgi:hypothetical protein
MRRCGRWEEITIKPKQYKAILVALEYVCTE